MVRIKLNNTTSIDLESLINTRLLVQANSGGGKSWLLRRLLEQSHGKVQQIVIDLEGEFSTLREKYDYILAGKGGDTPAEPRGAKKLAEKILELNISTIIDLYELKIQDRKHFVRLFLEAMINAPKKLWHPCLVIVDEAHQFAPQTGKAESTDAIIDLMTRGRKRGYCGILATQRISKLHKDTCAEANNKLIGRTGLDIDMNRAYDELGFSTKEQKLSLRDLAPGEFYAFGPALSRHVTKIKVGDVKTTHPRAGARIGYDKPASPTARIKRILEKLGDLPKEAEQEARTLAEKDAVIREQKREISRLGRQQPAPSKEQIDAAVKKAMAEKDREQDINLKKYEDYSKGLLAVIKKISGVAEKATKDFNVSPMTIRKTPTVSVPTGISSQHEHGSDNPPARRVFKKSNGRGDHDPDERPITGGALRMLKVLVSRFPIQLTRAQLATFARMSPRSGTFGTYLGLLRSRGMITDDGHSFQASEDGIAFLGEEPNPPQTSDEVIEQWQEVLMGGARRMFDVLVEEYPGELSREELGERAGLSSGSGTFGTYLGILNSNGLIEKTSGGIKASANLFMQ